MPIAPIAQVIAKRAPQGTLEIPIIGELGQGVLGEMVLEQLRSFRPKEVKFVIYSPGGEVFDALAVCGYMKANGIISYSEVYGYASSAATVFIAHSGPSRTSIAPGAFINMHMASGPDESVVADVNRELAQIYADAYGWTPKQALAYMAAGEENRGTVWFANDTKKAGICSEVMTELKVAAHAQIIKPAMAETTNKLKVEAKVKLGTMEAVRAAMGEGTTIEVEIDMDEATKATIQEKEAAIAALTTEVAALKAAQADGTANAEARTIAETEANTAKAALVTANETHISEVTALKAAHVAEIAALKAPVVAAVVANNVNVEPIAVKPSEVSEGAKIVKAALKQANPLQIAQAKMEAAKLAKA